MPGVFPLTNTAVFVGFRSDVIHRIRIVFVGGKETLLVVSGNRPEGLYGDIFRHRKNVGSDFYQFEGL